MDHVIVDLTARAYDGVAAIELAHASGRPVLAVGQHDDAPLRRRALAAGASRVHPYRLMYEDGPRRLEAWLTDDEAGGGAGMISSRPTIPATRYRGRMAAARSQAADAGYAAILVGVGADMRYLAGYPAMALERLTMLVIPAVGGPSLVAPAARGDPCAAVPAGGGRRPPGGHLGGGGRSARARGRDGPRRRVGRVRRRPASDRRLGRPPGAPPAAPPGAPARRLFDLGSPLLGRLRIVKDADEIALLTEAAHAADRVVAQIAAGRLVGRTEAEVAREVRERLLAEGHDEAHFAIVGSGPNSASPHHEASDRVIAAGEPIVLDIGGTIEGYGSDITRTLWVTGGDPANGPDERFRHLFGVLLGAQAAATRAAGPGVTPEAVDAAARRPIEAEGYGDAFFHRTGHGIGLQGHEDPYIIAGNTEPLREGMAFSVEPGIYLVGEYGARIEDIVVCGPDGPIALNEAPRELYVVDG